MTTPVQLLPRARLTARPALHRARAVLQVPQAPVVLRTPVHPVPARPAARARQALLQAARKRAFVIGTARPTRSARIKTADGDGKITQAVSVPRPAMHNGAMAVSSVAMAVQRRAVPPAQVQAVPPARAVRAVHPRQVLPAQVLPPARVRVQAQVRPARVHLAPAVPVACIPTTTPALLLQT